MSRVDVAWELGQVLRPNLPALPEQPNYWNEGRAIVRALADQGIVVSATLDRELRAAALDAALRSASGRLSATDTAGAAETLLGFLAGEPVEQPGTVILRGDDLVVLERAIARGGLRADDPAEDALGRRLVAARVHLEQAQAWKEKP